jgi:hypothetical protein
MTSVSGVFMKSLLVQKQAIFRLVEHLWQVAAILCVH